MFVIFLEAQCECLSLLSFCLCFVASKCKERFTFTHCLYGYRVCKIGNYHYVMSFSERVCVVCVCVWPRVRSCSEFLCSSLVSLNPLYSAHLVWFFSKKQESNMNHMHSTHHGWRAIYFYFLLLVCFWLSPHAAWHFQNNWTRSERLSMSCE